MAKGASAAKPASTMDKTNADDECFKSYSQIKNALLIAEKVIEKYQIKNLI